MPHVLSLVWKAASYWGVFTFWAYVAGYFVTSRWQRISPEAKAEMLRKRPKLVALVDGIATLGLDKPRFRRFVRTLAQGHNDPSVVAALDALADDDTDGQGITLTPALVPMPLLPSPLRGAYSPPAKTLAFRQELSERYVVVPSVRPAKIPSVAPDPEEREKPRDASE